MGKEINKGGRKPITMTDEQVSQIEALGSVLSIEQAMRVLKPIVYALCDKAGKPFYIGKTKNPSQRFMRYMEAQHAKI